MGLLKRAKMKACLDNSQYKLLLKFEIHFNWSTLTYDGFNIYKLLETNLMKHVIKTLLLIISLIRLSKLIPLKSVILNYPFQQLL